MNIENEIFSDYDIVARRIKTIGIFVFLFYFTLGISLMTNTLNSTIYYVTISTLALVAYFLHDKRIKITLFILFIVGIFVSIELFNLTMEKYEDFCMVIPIICLIIYPGSLYLNFISLLLASTYFIYPGNETFFYILEDALEIIIVTGLVSYISFQYETIKKQMLLFRHNSYHDSVTKLPNNNAYQKVVESKVIKDQDIFTLINLEIITLKEIVNFHGFEAGEDVLGIVANRLRNISKNDSQVFYKGLGEFSILLLEEDDDKVEDFISKIKEVISKTLIINDVEYIIQVSLGSAQNTGNVKSFDKLNRNANLAVQEAKKVKGSFYVKYSEKIGNENELKYLRIKEIKEAIINEEFVIHYQPKNKIISNNIIGLEALVRWNHPTMGIVYPNSFIELAEETGMIVDLGYYVFKEVCKFISKLVKTDINTVKVSVNLSPHQLNDPMLIENILEIMKQEGVDGKFLELEVTEGAIMEKPEEGIKILNELKKYGISISMDDFGVGYSSFTYIKDLPLDTIKLDRYFVKEITFDEKSRKIIRTIINMARNLGLQILAEGVETVEQLKVLEDMGCDAYQGYLESRPVDEDEIVRMLKRALKIG